MLYPGKRVDGGLPPRSILADEGDRISQTPVWNHVDGRSFEIEVDALAPPACDIRHDQLNAEASSGSLMNSQPPGPPLPETEGRFQFKPN